jgi:hypothetical protein
MYSSRGDKARWTGGAAFSIIFNPGARRAAAVGTKIAWTDGWLNMIAVPNFIHSVLDTGRPAKLEPTIG